MLVWVGDKSILSHVFTRCASSPTPPEINGLHIDSAKTFPAIYFEGQFCNGKNGIRQIKKRIYLRSILAQFGIEKIKKDLPQTVNDGHYYSRLFVNLKQGGLVYFIEMVTNKFHDRELVTERNKSIS